ncbi:hypothetical protein CAEBREN_26089 [Caenorhabditis brenneri]|uniref:Uncharacterized protein n=1 Tax=Caenorhabditis brenneri TaxID=135651 RepID=G0P6K8_CAEBE|nr:hypothetical protein CAEBREN_26089 [Caenorhabditis brenneri]
MDEAATLELQSVKEVVDNIRKDTKHMLMSMKQEQMKTSDFFANQLRHLRDICLEPAESSAYRHGVEIAERNATLLSKTEEDIFQALNHNKDKLSSALVKAKLLKETIMKDTLIAEKEIVEREQLKLRKQELKLQSILANQKIQEDILKIKELNKQERQENHKREMEKRERQQTHLSNVTSEQKKAEQRLKETKRQVEDVEHKRRFNQRVKSPTPTSRAAAKRQISYHQVLSSPQHNPPRRFFTGRTTQHQSTDSDEEPPKKKYCEVLISPSKKLPSRVMLPTSKPKDKKH